MSSGFFDYKYPLRDGHAVDLLVDGGAFFPAMLDAIDAAESSVVLAIYQVAPGGCADRWCQRLLAAAGRGVAVRIMVDGFGGFPARSQLEALRDGGVEMRWFNPVGLRVPLANFFRDHRKLLVVDGRLAFIGGFCLTDGFDPTQTDNPWHDMALSIRGPCIEDMLTEFERDWLLYGGTALNIAVETSRHGVSRCRLVRNHPRGIREIRRSTHRRIRQARRRIWLVTPYFAPARRLRRHLRRAARLGVDVRLLLSGAETDQETVRSAGSRHYGRMLRAGVRIFEYTGRCLHLKTVIIDDWVSGGSCNFDHWGLRWNRDANIEIENGEVVDAFETLLQNDFDGANEITRREYLARSLLQRLQQWFAGLIEDGLVRRTYRRQLRVLKDHPGRPRRS